MHRSARRLCWAALLLGLGCAAPAPPRREPPARGSADKAALYGDASLVPTREGERVRREVALAHELEAALVVLPSVTRARVDVELPERTTDSRVLAVVTGMVDADVGRLTDQLHAMARAVVGPAAAVEVVVELAPAPAAGPGPAPARWSLLLGVLGLGFFGGMLLERIRVMRRGSPPRGDTVARSIATAPSVADARRRARP
jgi:hypothetical protein